MSRYKQVLYVLSLLFLGSCISQADLVHRWSFNLTEFDSTIPDLVGNYDARLYDYTDQAYYADGQLYLGNDGSQSSNSFRGGDYVNFDNYMISEIGNQITFEIWATWDGSSDWQEMFCFGVSDSGENRSTGAGSSDYIMITPLSGDGTLRCGYRNGATSIERHLNTTPMTPGVEYHLVVSWDAANHAAYFYVNGQLVDQDLATHLDLSAMNDVNNWLGRSQWPDPLFEGSYNEFRIWNHALTSDEVMTNYIAGPDLLIENVLPASTPSPINGAIDIPLEPTLTWQSPSIDLVVGHQIYFGQSQTLVDNATTATTGVYKGQTAQNVLSYDPDAILDNGQTYYWRVDEVPQEGDVIKGPVWSFTVVDEQPSCVPGDFDGDCIITMTDLVLFANQWLDTVDCEGVDCPDLNQDQIVNLNDFANLATNWLVEQGSQVVINEINYNPDYNPDRTEFIELYNAGSQDVILTGWYFSDGINYEFPDGAFINSGQYYVITENADTFTAKFGLAPNGVFTGNLKRDGEEVVLRNADGKKIDEVEYQNHFPWPVRAGGGGGSMELINPSLDNNLGSSWRTSGYKALKPTQSEYLVEAASPAWHYRKGTSEASDPINAWQQVDFVEDNSWLVGQTSLGYGDNDDNTYLSDMQTNYSTIYMRHTFTIDSVDTIPDDIILGIYADDGCVVSINGVEVYRYSVGSGQLYYNSVADDNEAFWFTVDLTDVSSLFHAGTNVLAVHALNSHASSADFSIDVSLFGLPGEPEDVVLLDSGSSDWHYRKGTSEASSPTDLWRTVDFVEDTSWLIGQTSIGYGDGDDATLLNDMQNGYYTVYFRHELNLQDGDDIPDNIRLNMYVDDGCVVWINNHEVARFHVNPGDLNYNSNAQSHDASWEFVDLYGVSDYFQIGTNVIAVHGLNTTFGSTDFSFDMSIVVLAEDEVEDPFIPTPGKKNSVLSMNVPPNIRQVKNTPEQPLEYEQVTVTAKVTDPDGVATVKLSYQINQPGQFIPAFLPIEHDELIANPYQDRPVNFEYENPANWTTVTMVDDGTGNDEVAGDDIYTADIPWQANRTLVRYRITVADTIGNLATVPYLDDDTLNFAYYVYNGVPDYVASTKSVSPDGAGHVYSSDVLTSIPVYSLITRADDVTECLAYDGADQQPHDDNPVHQDARHYYNWEGAFFYDGKVYDHIRYRLRGANGRYHLAGKRSMKFRFNRGDYFQARDMEGKKYPEKWKHLSIGKMFGNRLVGNFGITETLNQKIWNIADVPAAYTHWFHFRVVDGPDEAPTYNNGQYYGDFWGMFLVFEQYDASYLNARDLPKTNLYKLTDRIFEGLRQLNYQGPDSVSNAEDYENIRWNLNSGATEEWIRQYVDIDLWYRYHTVSEAIRHYDVFPYPTGGNQMKNMAWYFVPDDTNPANIYGKMWFLPYDSDASWGPTWNEGKDHAKAALYDGSGKPVLKQEYRNYMREYRDLFWQPEIVNPMIDALAAQIADFVPADRDRWKDAPADAGTMDFGTLESKIADMKNFAWVGGFWPGDSSTYPGSAAILDQLAAAEGDSYSIPDTPVIEYIGPTGYPENHLEFRTGPFTDPQGNATFAAMKWRIAEVTDVTAPIYDPDDKPHYELNALWETDEITTFTETIQFPADGVKEGHAYRVRCKMKDDTGRWSHWSEPIHFIAGTALADELVTDLQLTEMMFNPAEADLGRGEMDVDNNEFEFIELQNNGSTTLDITNVSFTDGITFSFAGADITSLAPGEFVLVVRNRDAFISRYGSTIVDRIAGEYSGKLSGDGEDIKLEDFWSGTIFNFEYKVGRGWPQAGTAGHSLVPQDHAMTTEYLGSLDNGANWRDSAYVYGSPAAVDPQLPKPILINEVTAHTDFSDPLYPNAESNDWIELFNASDADVTFDGFWYLSDDFEELDKWQITEVTLTSGGFIVFDEVTGFHQDGQPGFGLSKAGEVVILSYLTGDNTNRVVDYIRFEGQENGESLGRYPDGGDYTFAMIPSYESTNTSPLERVLIREIMYHPDVTGEEFIKLFNPTDDTVLFTGQGGNWLITGEVDYEFPASTYLEPGQSLYIVDFDPQTETARFNNFMSRYGTGTLIPNVEIFGPWDGDLSNNGGRITLEIPLPPDLPDTDIPDVIEDEVFYFDRDLWPSLPDGTGASLGRISLSAEISGSDPTNWTSVIY